jgi:hypothetical protein
MTLEGLIFGYDITGAGATFKMDGFTSTIFLPFSFHSYLYCWHIDPNRCSLDVGYVAGGGPHLLSNRNRNWHVAHGGAIYIIIECALAWKLNSNMDPEYCQCCSS